METPSENLNRFKDLIATIWRVLSTTRYTRLLEDEIDRLREENRGLLNSLLTRAGVSPIDLPKPAAPKARRMSRHQFQIQLEREAMKREQPTA